MNKDLTIGKPSTVLGLPTVKSLFIIIHLVYSYSSNALYNLTVRKVKCIVEIVSILI